MNDKNRWRTSAFRTHIIEKIEEEILKSSSSSTKSAQELEDEEFRKAVTEKDYSVSIARLIYNMRRSKSSTQTSTPSTPETLCVTSYQEDDAIRQQSLNIGDTSTKNTKKFKSRRSFVCAVCYSTFANKRSVKNHIRNTQHMVSNSLPQFLMSMLPRQRAFTVCNYFKTANRYKLEICLPHINSIEQTQEWMKEFAKLNDGAFVWERSCTTKNISQRKIIYGCRYSDKRPDKPNKSKISFTIKEKDPSYAIAIVDLDYDQTPSPNDDSRQCHPSAEVKEILYKYLENSMNPTEAYRNLQLHIEMQLESENDYLEYISDRRKMPVLSWVRQLYNSTYQGPQLVQKNDLEILKKFAEDKNEEHGEPVFKFQNLPNDNFVVFIVTAFMKRALQSQAAAELIYTDNVGSAAQYGLKVHLILTNIKGEAVPLAVMISSSETNKAIKTGFNLLSAYIDDQCFNGKGKLGPAIIMTDDSIAEMSSMKALFPYSKIVLSEFHFLRASYKWLIKIEHKISKQNREIIYAFVRHMVYSDNESILRNEFEKLLELFKNNELICNYVCKLYEKRQTWATCYRRNFVSLDSRGNRWKQTLSTLKQQITSRVKLQEPKRLMLYFLNEFSDFYRRRLIDCALDRYANEFHIIDHYIKKYEILTNEQCESLVTVRDKETGAKYLVNMDINLCTCYFGSAGGLCEHQKALHTLATPTTEIVDDTETKLVLYYIVSGCKDVPEEFFGLSNQENIYLSSDQLVETEQFFDNGVQEETIVEEHPQFIHVQVTQFNQLHDQEIETQQLREHEHSAPLYPIIIDNNVEDESVVQIDESSLPSDEIGAESVPKIIYSIVVDENVDKIKTQSVFEDVDEQPSDRLRLELNKFHENFVRLRDTINENPIVYEHGLKFLNNELRKVKNDPAALLRAISSFES